MSMVTTIKQIIGTTAGALLLALAVSANAQNAGPTLATSVPPSATPPAAGTSVILYGGEAVSASQVKIAPWGGGTTQDQQGEAFTTSGHTIEVNTAGLYQGGQIIFPTPVALGDLKSDKTRYLQIVFSVAPSSKYPKTNPATAQFTTPGYRGGRPSGFGFPGGLPPGTGFPGANRSQSSYHYSYNGQIGVMPQVPQGYHGPSPQQIAAMMAAGRNGAMQGRGGPPYMGGLPPGMRPGGPFGPPTQIPGAPDETNAPPVLPIQDLHVILQFADGDQVEMLRPVIANVGDDTNWFHASIPLASVPVDSAEAANAQLTNIYLGSDAPATVEIGEIRTVTDATPLTADAGEAQTVPTNSTVSFVGAGEGGASMLSYDWNFDSPNSFVSEAQGNHVTHRFTKAGDYVVTLRVSDVDGLKAAATATVTVHVTDE